MAEVEKPEVRVDLRFDMRSPAFGTSARTLFPEAVRLAEYCDRHGFHTVRLPEHHGSDDGYNPSPLVLASAIAARTERLLLRTMVILPLHDPLRIAEDIAVLDNHSRGRVMLCVAGGYVEDEYRMFGRDIRERPRLVEHGIAVLRRAWTGEPFEVDGRPVRVLPRPVCEHLPILMGGSSPAAARRAGRIADGFITHLPELHQVYADEARRNGREPMPFRRPGPSFVHVARDPDAAWQRIAPHALHDANAYGSWQGAARVDGGYRSVADAEALQKSGSYPVLTPEECIALARREGALTLHPLMGGMDPDLGWESLELLVAEVLPRLCCISPSQAAPTSGNQESGNEWHGG